MSQKKLVRRGLILLERLRALGCEVTQASEDPAALQAAMSLRPNECVAWENGTPGDHDAPYVYGQLADGQAATLLSPDELRNLAQLQASWQQLPLDDDQADQAEERA